MMRSVLLLACLGAAQAESSQCLGEFVDDGSGECVLKANGGDVDEP